MLYRQRAVFACQGNDVEPDGQVDAELAQIGIGRRNDSSNLCIVDAFLRGAELAVASGSDLYDNEFSLMLGHDVQFLPARTPVAVADAVDLAFEEAYRFVFSVFL